MTAKTLMLSVAVAALALAGTTQAAPKRPAAKAAAPAPYLAKQDGKFALMVDGAPFLMLAGQANNSSNYPAALPKVWPAISDMHANTLVMPVAWEQIEPKEGQFDFSFVDELIKQAREHNVRLDILWFGTWKNTGPQYTPEWVKSDNKRFPRLIGNDGKTSYSLSPLYDTTREADKTAYVELVKHIKAIDGQQHTVILLQIENEAGVYGATRDHSAKADALMNEAVPQDLVTALGKANGNWHEVFGTDADEMFHAWSIARYVDDIAAAGKAVYPLPTYMNDALRDPINPPPAGSFATGGPTYDALDLYKVAAPHVDILAPDLYTPFSQGYEKTLELYHRPDNALFVAESGNKPVYARYLFTTLGRQGIGFDPFGFDYTGYSNYPLGNVRTNEEFVTPFGTLYQAFAPMSRLWAKLSYEGQVWGVSEPDDHAEQQLDLGSKWHAKVQYRLWQFGMPEWDPEHKNGYPEGSDVPGGGVAVARLSDDEFLVTGIHARISFDVGDGQKDKGFILGRVEEGHYDDKGNWVFERVWNGDETDYGLNFTDKPVVLHVKLATYEK